MSESTQVAAATTPEPAPARKGKPALSEGKKAERRLGLWLVAPAAIVMLVVTAYPILYSIWLSLERYDLHFPDQQKFIGLANYGAVLTNSYWWTAFGVTMLITIVSVVIEIGRAHV